MSRLALPRRRLLRAGFALGLGAGFGLGAPAVRACDFFTSNLRINHVWTRATADASYAVVCMSFEEVADDDRLIGAETPVAAGAAIGGPAPQPAVDVFIPRSRTTVLDEAGAHLRLTGLRQPLVFGASYPLVLHFERGGAVLADVDVEFGPLLGSSG